MKKITFTLTSALMVGCAGALPITQKGAVLVLTPRILAGQYQTQGTVTPYTSASIDHLTLKIFQGTTELTAKTLLSTQLNNPIAFSNLKVNTPYRIKAYAYLADNTLISHDDPSSWLDITTATDDRPGINPIPVHLVDISFAGQGTGSLQITPGGYLSGDPLSLVFFGISTFAGNGTMIYSSDQEGIAATNASINAPCHAAFDSAGNCYVAVSMHHRIRKISPYGTITTVAGDGVATFSVDGVPATASSLSTPTGTAVDASGNLYIADYKNHRIRKVTPDGTISTVAGNGTAAFSGDGGQATAACLYEPYRIVVDGTGVLYIADYKNHRIRKVTPDGIISTVAGNGTAGFTGDGGSANAAGLKGPTGLALDASGNLYIADSLNHRIRKVTKSGQISTVAGDGTAKFSGDGDQATAASLNSPHDVTFDAEGNLYIADTNNNRIRKVQLNGVLTTVAGNGTIGFTGDGAIATNVSVYMPTGVAINRQGDLIILDFANNRMRRVVNP